jgi:methylenetetrahydrofolate dehydrogenase (NADP+)/methenyltetrahydrofolate cyclohydrolase
MPIRMEGRPLARLIEAQLRTEIQRLKTEHLVHPCLASVLIGDDPASLTYQRMQKRACDRIGMDFLPVQIPVKIDTGEVVRRIQELNNRRNVHGILLGHPVPKGIDEQACFHAIDTRKDVDGVNPTSFGHMALGVFAYGGATPRGMIHLLQHYGIEISGKHAVVVGRSPIVGKPLGIMFLQEQATVTICHSRTVNLRQHLQQAEILAVAVGRERFIKAEWVPEGCVLLDAGFHPSGVGDVDPAAFAKCRAYTPVPGGIGPVTLATVLSQTVDAARRFGLRTIVSG